MAIDTKAKRFSMLNFGDGTNLHLLPDPDGTIDAGDRAHLLDLYSGIALSGEEEEARTRYAGLVANVGRLKTR